MRFFAAPKKKLFILGGIFLLSAFGIGLLIADHIDQQYGDFPDIPLPDINAVNQDLEGEDIFRSESFVNLPPPPPPSIQRMKNQGCVTDGLLSGYGEKTKTLVKLINRSHCYYLHRSIETWLRPPDFELAEKIKKQITKTDLVYGMFIAEAIDTRADYHYDPEDRDFDFKDMCRNGSENFWGEHTCKPSLEKREYSLYVQYITRQAMDMGVQSFMFGQVHLQDAGDRKERSFLPGIISNMRGYAASKDMQIVIGAQTNDIEDPTYLKMFDYIEGGTGLHTDGSIENQACFSRWWKQPGDWCWALLWHDNYASKANNVFIHLDWSGKLGDDMSTFARMTPEKRAEVIQYLHAYFTKKNIGFLLPYLSPLPKDNGGCFGPKERFYSANKEFGCPDESAFNQTLKNTH